MICFWPPVIEQWRLLIEQQARRAELDPALVAAIVWAESGGNPSLAILERDGLYSYGLMMVHGFDYRPGPDVLLDPSGNLWVGASLLRDIIDRARGNVALALAAYNCGWAGVAQNKCGRYGGYAYAEKVLGRCREFCGCGLKRSGREDLIQ